ncbi:MAG: ATP synthase F1 subunit gamma [Lachnospiraceae bacterium]|nr:ATP synthase F1 subunit gamma [Lachnospiraceae bacterium]
MANTKEIKNRIKSVQDTQKITDAMYLISSTKLRRAKSDLDKTKPYFDGIRSEIKRFMRTADKEIENRYLFPPNDAELPPGGYACLVVTADKGLAGAYNQNAIKEAMKFKEENPDTLYFVIGEYGRHYFRRHGIPYEESFLYTAADPSLSSARRISSLLLDYYDKGRINKVFIVYTDMKNSLSYEAVSERLIPFHREHFERANENEKPVQYKEFEFYPSLETVLNTAIESYICGYIYSALVDSFCAEQNARMTAMSAASDNAQELVDSLRVKYNRVRQGSITQEITEVSAGARAQKKKSREEIS